VPQKQQMWYCFNSYSEKLWTCRIHKFCKKINKKFSAWRLFCDKMRLLAIFCRSPFLDTVNLFPCIHSLIINLRIFPTGIKYYSIRLIPLLLAFFKNYLQSTIYWQQPKRTRRDFLSSCLELSEMFLVLCTQWINCKLFPITVVDPDQHGSETFCRIRIHTRGFGSGSGSGPETRCK
jgi:hypothetical protein